MNVLLLGTSLLLGIIGGTDSGLISYEEAGTFPERSSLNLNSHSPQHSPLNTDPSIHQSNPQDTGPAFSPRDRRTVDGWSLYHPVEWAHWGGTPEEFAESTSRSDPIGRAKATEIFGYMPLKYVPEELLFHALNDPRVGTLSLEEAKFAIRVTEGLYTSVLDHQLRRFRTFLTWTCSSPSISPPSTLPTRLRFQIIPSDTSICSICLEEYLPPRLDLNKQPEFQLVSFLKECRHHFHPGCIDKWIHQGELRGAASFNCPNCRKAISFHPCN